MRRTTRGVAAVAITAAVAVLGASPAVAHDHRTALLEQQPQLVGPLEPATAHATLGVASLARPAPRRPSVVPFEGELTNVPVDPAVSYPSPTAACDVPSCAELQVDVPTGTRTLYGTIGWERPNHYLNLYALSPDGKVYGNVEDDFVDTGDYQAQSVENTYDKTVGNALTIPRAQFTVENPTPGTWVIRARSVFSYKTRFTGRVAATAEPPVVLARLDNRALADAFVLQPLRVNVVFAGRTPDTSTLDGLKANLPDRYYPAVIGKNTPDCTEDDDDVDCNAGTLLNWHGAHYSGTKTSKDDTGADRGGRVPWFEAMTFRYEYKFYEADELWTRDLFARMAAATEKDSPLGPPVAGTSLGQSGTLAAYNARAGAFRGPDAQVLDTSKADKIDPFAVEDWIFASRLDPKYRWSFKDLDTGVSRDGRFINPDPDAYYDPFYDAKGVKNLNRIPQGPATSVTYFVLDTFTSKLAREYFRPNTYHAFDVSRHMVNPDTDAPDGPDFMRLWGGRYRFFFLDMGAMPNGFEALDWTGKTPTDSASPPWGDPPIWEIDNNPVWDGMNTYVEKVSRDIRAALAYRFTASYLYRPVPADVYFVANNTWSDFYSRPEGGGISWSDLTKLYDAPWVERNLSSALPAATFTTERSHAGLRTFRYLGCSNERAGSASTATGLAGDVLGTPLPYPPKVMVPDPSCTKPDKFQHALEEAKAQGDDVAGVGANASVVSAGVVRRFVEENRAEIAPDLPGQLTITNISVVFPGTMTWTLPAIVGGIAFGTPNNEAWGVLQNVNDRFKMAKATDCSKSPLAPECKGAPIPTQDPGSGFSYTIEHEASHFLGLTHPHDSVMVEKDDEGRWDYYKSQYTVLYDFSQAPTTYAGSFAPYSVLDQDIIQRGHVAEYLQMAQDWLADAYLQDGVAGYGAPTKATYKRQAAMEGWRDRAAALFRCGDYLHAEYAARNAYLAAQGVFGPAVAPRPLQPGERVLFRVTPQPVYGPDGAIAGCRPPVGEQARAIGGELPATGGGGTTAGLAALAAGAWLLARRRRRCATLGP